MKLKKDKNSSKINGFNLKVVLRPHVFPFFQQGYRIRHYNLSHSAVFTGLVVITWRFLGIKPKIKK